MDYDNDHECPVYQKMISADLCYDSIMVLGKYFKVESLSELQGIQDIESARKVCKECPYSNMM